MPEHDPVGLCAALCRLVESPERWAEMGRRASRTVAARFEGGAQIAALEGVYRRVLRAGKVTVEESSAPVVPAPARVVVVARAGTGF